MFKYIIFDFAIVISLFISCLVLSNFKTKEDAVLTEYWKHDTTIALQNGIYQLELQTIIVSDTLREEWVEYGFLD